MVDRERLLSACTGLNLYRGFKSLPPRQWLEIEHFRFGVHLKSPIITTCACSSVGLERLLAEQKARGSSPFRRTGQQSW